VLFEECCDYFDNCYALLNMLDSESMFTNATNFTPVICRQITWAIINESRQYFFHTVMADQFSVLADLAVDANHRGRHKCLL